MAQTPRRSPHAAGGPAWICASIMARTCIDHAQTCITAMYEWHASCWFGGGGIMSGTCVLWTASRACDFVVVCALLGVFLSPNLNKLADISWPMFYCAHLRSQLACTCLAALGLAPYFQTRSMLHVNTLSRPPVVDITLVAHRRSRQGKQAM